jgi:nitroreductase
MNHAPYFIVWIKKEQSLTFTPDLKTDKTKFNLKRTIMNKKTTLLAILLLIMCTAVLKGQTTGNGTIDAIMSGYSAKMFTSEPVSDKDLDLILRCGMKAPSARNSQMWKFTVVKDSTLTGEIVNNITPGNVLIIVSGLESEQKGANIDFDCALATENMYIAAQSLGLGAHIYGSPVNTINTTKKEVLAIPGGYRVVTVLRVGHIDKSVDAVSSASTRKKIEEVVNFK